MSILDSFNLKMKNKETEYSLVILILGSGQKGYSQGRYGGISRHVSRGESHNAGRERDGEKICTKGEGWSLVREDWC